ncbi:MAG: hypothetical protein KAH38_12140 [Candidatus Hydrogenedentes bacterium]|nr:hypothetical protein [Candidatus Hydrogenedentota bacterium]
METLLQFLWREWTALGVSGQEHVELHHVIDPEALLLFTCSLGRYDQRLFDEVMDWLTKNGSFLNIQRMKNILQQEAFGGGEVLSAVADWLSQYGKPMKWKSLAKLEYERKKAQPLFYLADGRSLPIPTDYEETFLEHGFKRSSLRPRGYSQAFPAGEVQCLLLKLRALFSVNARCDVMTYLALNGTGYPREVARELYYSQKAIHDLMTEMACSGMVFSSRSGRARIFRISDDSLPFLTNGTESTGWINWPILLSTAEAIWKMTEELHTTTLDPAVENSEILLTTKPLLERFTRCRWAPAIQFSQPMQGLAKLEAFKGAFETVVT